MGSSAPVRPMRSATDLAYTFPDVDTAAAFAKALRAKDSPAPGSLHGLLDETGSELESVKRSKRVVKAVLVLHDDGCLYAREAAYEAGQDRDFEKEIWGALDALVEEHGGSKWRPGFEATEASAPQLAALREEGATAFAILEAPPQFVKLKNPLGMAQDVYGDRAKCMAVLNSPRELRLTGRWKLLRGAEVIGSWAGALGASTLTLDAFEEGPGWKPGDLVVYEAPPSPPKATGLLGRLKTMLGG